MKLKYKFPIQSLIILEHVKLKLWINKNLNINNFYLVIPQKWFLTLIYILKNEVFLSSNILVEHSIQDNLQSSSNHWLKNNKRFFFFYNIFFLHLKTRLLIYIINSNIKSGVISIDNQYKNASWLERESSEMYGCLFNYKKDIRKLLLNYSQIEAPLLKDFPVEGVYKIFFNFFFNQTYFYKNEVAEL